MAYDAAHNVTVLFGGQGNQSEMADTWTWNGTNWTQQHPATSPWLGDRLGPTAVIVPDDHLQSLREALKGLGISLDGE